MSYIWWWDLLNSSAAEVRCASGEGFWSWIRNTCLSLVSPYFKAPNFVILRRLIPELLQNSSTWEDFILIALTSCSYNCLPKSSLRKLENIINNFCTEAFKWKPDPIVVKSIPSINGVWSVVSLFSYASRLYRKTSH